MVGGRLGIGFGFGQEVEGALVAAAGLGDAVEAGDGFDVVVEDLGAGVDDELAGSFDALEVGGEDFDLAAGGLAADLQAAVRAMRRPGGAEVVGGAVDAGEDGGAAAELGDGVGDAGGVGVVDGLGAALGHGAEAAAAGAQIAEHHEGGGFTVPALADVGALGGLADGVEVEVAGEFFEVVEGFADGGAGLEPLGLFGGFARAQVDLHECF